MSQDLVRLGIYAINPNSPQVAISNNRLLNIDDGKVTFRWKDYRDGDAQKTMTLAAEEFIRRFLLHVLPSGFHRIRYYGFLGNRHREEKLAQCRALVSTRSVALEKTCSETPADYRDRYAALTGRSLHECPACHRGRMITVSLVLPSRDARSPPVLDTS